MEECLQYISLDCCHWGSDLTVVGSDPCKGGYRDRVRRSSIIEEGLGVEPLLFHIEKS